uniref:Fe2OG dioxygenase domain-containing protein n=2 Tax=Alexandrium monilatum TaxID=311494 RepID=A0A7S4RQF4_9DINO
MNRYGVVLDQVGLQTALEGLVAAHVRPLAAMLFPELVGAEDAEEHYAFTVRYEAAGDTELAKHADASVATLNLCLGRRGWKGGALRFFDSGGSGIYALPRGNASAGAGDVEFSPGLALFHRGQHKHQALPLLSGERTNVIIWLFGRDGVVRAAPFARHEQLSAGQRWGVSFGRRSQREL